MNKPREGKPGSSRSATAPELLIDRQIKSRGVRLSVRVVDGVYGGPAVGVCVRLLTETEGIRTERLRQRTDSDGCMIAELSASLAPGLGRLALDINGYFATLGVSPFYPEVTVSFRLSNSVSAYEIIVIVTPSTYAVFKGNWNGGNAQGIGG